MFAFGKLTNLAKKIVDNLAPPPEDTPQESIAAIWKIISESLLTNDEQTLNDIHINLFDLLNVLKDNIDSEYEIEIFNELAKLQIPSNLVSYAVANSPNGINDQVYVFFTEFLKPPLTQYLTNPFIINPLNSLIENVVPNDVKLHTSLIYCVFQYVENDIKQIKLFISEGKKSPFVTDLIKLSVIGYENSNAEIMRLFALAKNSEHLHNLLISNPSIYSPIISFIKECIQAKTIDDAKHEFLEEINNCVSIMLPDIREAFAKEVNKITYEMVVNESPESALRNAIYYLATFSNKTLIEYVVSHLITKLPIFLKMEDNDIIYLSIKCCQLLLEHTTPRFPDIEPTARITSKYMNCLAAEWFVRPDVEDVERLRVEMAAADLAAKEFPRVCIWDAKKTVQAIFALTAGFFERPLNVCFALCEFFGALAAVPDAATAYFALSPECCGGLYDCLRDLSMTATRRIGARPGTEGRILEAYERGEEEEDGLFRRVVMLLELLKELNCRCQIRSSFRSRGQSDIN